MPTPPPSPGLDLVRLGQFLELAGELLLGGRDTDTVATRVAQGAALVLRLPGVAVGVLDDGYTVRAVYAPGVDASWATAPAGAARDAVAARHPAVLPSSAPGRRVLLLPFRGPRAEGALHLLLPERGGIGEDDVALARVFALLAGLGLSTAARAPGSRAAALDEFALDELVGELRAGPFAQPTSEGRLRWRPVAGAPRLRTDRPKLRDIVALLLRDALGPGTGEVEVDIAATTRDSLRITVRDAGGSLAPEALPARVHALAESLGGRIAARSTLTEGTAVTVEIPCVAPAGAR